MTDREHPIIRHAGQEFADGKLERRAFLRIATLLGMSAASAYAMVGLPAPARAQGAMPKGGTLRIGMRCGDISNPPTYSWIEMSNSARQVLDYLTVTGSDNVTRPSLAASWEASPDLKTWTLHLRRDVKWRKGRPFTADDAVWNLKHSLDPKTGSSMVGLFTGFLMEEVDTGEVDAKGKPKKSSRLWDANAIEKVDDFTVRLNGKSPQLAVPESLYHYPMLIMDPEDGGKFGVGSNGTGAFELVEAEVGRKQMFKARQSGYWGTGPYIDQLEFIDLGDDPAAQVAAMASKQVEMLYSNAITNYQAFKQLPHLQMLQVNTAFTAVARMQPVKPFDDKRVRQAVRYATDTKAVLQIAHLGMGAAGEHFHVAPVHPEYAKLPFLERDVAKAKALLAEAGYPGGIDVEIACKPEPAWELLAVQAMVEQWKEAGIRTKINVMPASQYWDNWTKVPFGFTTWAHRPLGTMVLALGYRTGQAWNESKWSNPEFDKLVTEAEGYLDVEKRRAVMAKIEALMQDDGPAVIPLWQAIFSFTDKRVKGFHLHPSSYINAVEIAVEA